MPEMDAASNAATAIRHDGDEAPILTAQEMEGLERANIERALATCSGKISGDSGAAKRLGLKPSTLSSRMKALGIQRKG